MISESRLLQRRWQDKFSLNKSTHVKNDSHNIDQSLLPKHKHIYSKKVTSYPTLISQAELWSPKGQKQEKIMQSSQGLLVLGKLQDIIQRLQCSGAAWNSRVCRQILLTLTYSEEVAMQVHCFPPTLAIDVICTKMCVLILVTRVLPKDF